MENIIVYPENTQQAKLISSLLKKMNIKFDTLKSDKTHILTKDEFVNKINESIQQYKNGETLILTAEEQEKLLG